jgi:formylglycine-generating enzyme required for sulfatase activity
VSGEPTDSSITVGEVTLTRATGQSIEYGISRTPNEVGISAWQSGRTFNNLDGGTQYYVFARAKANADWSLGDISERSSGILTASPIVRFNIDGGRTNTGETSIEDREMTRGQRIDQSSIPSLTKTNYEFDYWYKDEDYRIPYNFDDPVNASFTLYAKWIATSEKNAEALKGFVYVKGGWYKMGTTDSAFANAAQHDVGISGFWMGKYEVTQAEWSTIMGTNPSNFKTAVADETETPGKLPVESISWYEALVYCNKLSIKEGYVPAYLIKTQDYPNGTYYPDQWGAIPSSNPNPAWNAVTIIEGSDGYRLPTEAQWEYACRAGTTTNYSTGDTIDANTGWYGLNSAGKTHQVGLKPSNSANGNQWGLYDMHGNVAERCWDWYNPVYDVNKRLNPTGPDSGDLRVSRGGAYDAPAVNLRSAWRSDNHPPTHRAAQFGLRVVRP